MVLEARIWASRLGFGPRGWNLGLESGILALRLEFRRQDWDLRGGDKEENEGENPPYVCKHRSSTPLGPLPQSGKMSVLDIFVCVGMGIGMWMGVGSPCPPISNNVVTLRHLFALLLLLKSLVQTIKPAWLFF